MGLAGGLGRADSEGHPGGAAERAGLHGGDQQAYVGNTPILLGGDLIVAIDGQQVTDPQDINADHGQAPGRRYGQRDLLRGRKQMTLKLILGEARDANG